MMIPTVHMNGTSRKDLIADLKDSVFVLDQAIKTLCKGAPHGRDYYPQGGGAYTVARIEHEARVNKLAAIKTELVEIAEAVMQA